MRHRVFKTVTAIACSMAVTVAHAATLPLEVTSLLAYADGISIAVPDAPEVRLVDGFGTPDPGSPLAAPWQVPVGAFVWADDGSGVGKPGGQSSGANVAVLDVGVRDVRVTAAIAGLIDGPGGGGPTLTGLALLSDGGSQHLLVHYERRSGVLTVSTPAGTLGSIDIGSGRSAIDTIEVDIRFPEVRVAVDGVDVLVVTGVPAAYATHTRHGIYAERDNRAVFTRFTVDARP